MNSLLKEQGREDFSGVQTEDLFAELRSVTRNTLHPKSMLDGTAEAMADLVFDLGQQLTPEREMSPIYYCLGTWEEIHAGRSILQAWRKYRRRKISTPFLKELRIRRQIDMQKEDSEAIKYNKLWHNHRLAEQGLPRKDPASIDPDYRRKLAKMNIRVPNFYASNIRVPNFNEPVSDEEEQVEFPQTSKSRTQQTTVSPVIMNCNNIATTNCNSMESATRYVEWGRFGAQSGKREDQENTSTNAKSAKCDDSLINGLNKIMHGGKDDASTDAKSERDDTKDDIYGGHYFVDNYVWETDSRFADKPREDDTCYGDYGWSESEYDQCGNYVGGQFQNANLAQAEYDEG